MKTFYDYSVPRPDGTELDLSSFKGKVVIVVNTATGCGFTPHYEPLEKLYEEYHDKGLEILDIPCNQFAGQTPGSDEQIHEFCTLKYNTQFPQMKKSDVNGENALPVYAFLKEKAPYVAPKGFKAKIAALAFKAGAKDSKGENDVKWNFTKFVVDREGNVIARYEPTYDMKKFSEEISKLF